ncbi:MAG: hypothetical protein ACI8T1_003060, partial [Verrucomicrobiales bacterium]
QRHLESDPSKKVTHIPDVFWFYIELGLAKLWPSHWPKD